MEKYIITFFVFIVSIFMTLIIENKMISFLQKKAKQPIYQEGPSWHISKLGTPTMGGLAFLISITVNLFLSSIVLLILKVNHREILSILISLVFAVSNSAIGIIDDFTKLKRKENAGLSPFQKLGLQTVFALLFLFARKFILDDDTIINLFSLKLDLGIAYFPFMLILILGVINCANLTDGIDGLASGVAVTIGTAFLIIGYGASYCTPIISAAVVGGAIGFLFYNVNPARIFMGDTGSLFLGALVVCLGFSTNNPLLTVPLGIIYVIEGLSVIIQVLFFKMTKKRVFKMAPLHHHLEKCGLNENSICVIAVITTMIFSAATYLLTRS